MKIDSPESIFTQIYEKGIWQFGGTRDGDYSNPSHAQKLIDGLIPFLKKWNITSIFDASCGEHFFTREIDFAGNNITYIGGEIVKEKIVKLKIEFPEKDFRVFNIIEDPFPETDVWMCKDTLIHFPIYYTQQTLRNFVSSNTKYCLITSLTTGNHAGENNDISEFGMLNGGNHRCVITNFNIPPFDFPEPLDILEYTAGEEVPPYATPEERVTMNARPRFFLFLYDRETIAGLPFLQADLPEPG